MPPQLIPARATSRPRDPNLNRKLNRMRSLSPIFFLVSTLLCASALAQSSAIVTTDQADYPPGGIVLITGAGFTPGEIVTNQVLHIPDDGDNNTSTAHQPWTVTADADGNFSTTWDVPFDQDELGATLQLTATGQTSGLTAQVTFTDSASLTLNPANPVAISPNADGVKDTTALTYSLGGSD